MEHRISVLFYARTSKKTSKGLVPLYIRITINGRRLEHSIQRLVETGQWSRAAGRVKGSNEQARQINLYLDTLTGKVRRLEREMEIDNQSLTFTKFSGEVARPHRSAPDADCHLSAAQ